MEARQSLVDFIQPDQPDWPRAVALLRPIAKHEALRESILTSEVIEGFLQLLDHVIAVQEEHFADVMDALSSLVELRMLANRCVFVRALIILQIRIQQSPSLLNPLMGRKTDFL